LYVFNFTIKFTESVARNGVVRSEGQRASDMAADGMGTGDAAEGHDNQDLASEAQDTPVLPVRLQSSEDQTESNSSGIHRLHFFSMHR
jgi:hypothetical protein